MDRTLSNPLEKQETRKIQIQLKLCLPLLKPKSSNTTNPFSQLVFWVHKLLRIFSCNAKVSNRFFLRRLQFSGTVVNNSVFCGSHCFPQMEGSVENIEEMGEKRYGFCVNWHEIEGFGDRGEEGCRESSGSSSDNLASETTVNEEQSSSEGSSSPSSMRWPVKKTEDPQCASSNVSQESEKTHLDDRKLQRQGSTMSEIEMMKERFAKLLLGEDMSGCGNGVCTSLAISNAITNLCATLFGQIWRLEPLAQGKKVMWRREMEWLLSVSDHIVELIPSWQTFPDGSKLEVMTCRPRSDLYVNLPALRKLDNMLLEILDSFDKTEFWYVEQGIVAPEADGSSSFRNLHPRQEEKWWLPVPRVPTGGLTENARKQLQHKRDSTNQILKASMAINSSTLADMEVPDSFLESLPKNAKASLGDLIHRYIMSDQFSPECLMSCLDLSSEHQALEIANRVEASIYVWRRKSTNSSKPLNSTIRSNSRSSWEFVKDLVMDAEKRELLADRAESLLFCLKQRFPGLPQTTLDMTKIQYNKDVGKSILESYSRVLESLAFNIVARIDDLIYVDDMTKHSDQFLSICKVGVISHKTVGVQYSVPVSSTPYKTAFTTPKFSPLKLISPNKGEMSPYIDGGSIVSHQGLGVKKVLTDFLSIDMKGKQYGNQIERTGSFSSTVHQEVSATAQIGDVESFDSSKEGGSKVTRNSAGEE